MHKKIKIFLIVIIVILAGLFSFNFLNKNASENNSNSNANTAPAVKITYANIEQILSQSDIAKDLPDNGSLLLKFYNFNSGQREWENSYAIKKNSCKQGSENADIIISLHSKYLNDLTTQNFCFIVQQAKVNGDVGFETTLSSAQLLWKYKGMMKYKDCFGF